MVSSSSPLHIALICGGPSKERGISLNSARSFLDHTSSLELDLSIFYLSPNGLFYQLTPGQLYSNTPSDFDFKLTSKPLMQEELIRELHKMDLVFPLIHGTYGEDGTLQQLLEEHSIPFVGSSSLVCKNIFNKHRAHNLLAANGFEVLPSLYIGSKETPIEPFWIEQKLRRAILKPTESGSSLGVTLVDSVQAAKEAVSNLWRLGFKEMLLEPYCEESEFTLCILENKGKAVSLIPLEIEIGKGEIFDYRKKYLPSEQTRYYCPPRFPETTLAKIRSESERLFIALGLRDFIRIDGWVSSEGKIRFSDLNPISGMEQNSFLFQQASRVGMTHADLIESILTQALSRYDKPPLKRKRKSSDQNQAVYVLMGGNTSERQVSLLSGTNVWLKLMQTEGFDSTPFLLHHDTVWQLPYGFALHHSVEEMVEHCQTAQGLVDQIDPLCGEIRKRLNLSPLDSTEIPKAMSLEEFLDHVQKTEAFLFLALHGGMGEDGTLQKELEERKIPFNGSRSAASRLCMDKYETAKQVETLNNPNILSMNQISFEVEKINIDELWKRAQECFKLEDLIIKPQQDGCSTGVVRLRSLKELKSYQTLLINRERFAPPHTFLDQPSLIQMPRGSNQPFLLEPFIETDKITIFENRLIHQSITGWCEMTIGVLEENGRYEALNPSITVAESHVLSLEEKFQGGTGINITPPPIEILSDQARKLVQRSACEVAKAMGIQGYARLDLFVELATGKIRVIEANTLPALTPSTVLYQQAMSQERPIPPKELLTRIIKAVSFYKLTC